MKYFVLVIFFMLGCTEGHMDWAMRHCVEFCNSQNRYVEIVSIDPYNCKCADEQIQKCTKVEK